MSHNIMAHIIFSSVQSLSRVWFFVIPWTIAYQTSLSFTDPRSLLKLFSTELVIPSNHLILYHPLLLTSTFLSIRVITNESVLHIRCQNIGISMIQCFSRYSATWRNMETVIFQKWKKNGSNKIMALINNKKTKQ